MAETLNNFKPRNAEEAAFLAELLANESTMGESARKKLGIREQAVAGRNQRAVRLNRLDA